MNGLAAKNIRADRLSDRRRLSDVLAGDASFGQRPDEKRYHLVEMPVIQVQARMHLTQRPALVGVRPAERHGEERGLHGGQFRHVHAVEQRFKERIGEDAAVKLRRHLPDRLRTTQSLIQGRNSHQAITQADGRRNKRGSR